MRGILDSQSHTIANVKVAFHCLWQQDALNAFESGLYPMVEEITESELQSLIKSED